MNWKYLFLALEGRIPRLSFWIAMAILIVIELVILLPFGWQRWDPETNPAPLAFRILQFLVSLVLAYPFYAVAVKRLHDRNSPGTLALVTIALMLISDFINIFWPIETAIGFTVPGYIVLFPFLVLTIVLAIELGFRRGTSGPNTYGPDPLASAQ